MTLQPHELKALAMELSAAMGPVPPSPVELVCATGEMFSPAALNLARIYDATTDVQRSVLDQIALAFKAA